MERMGGAADRADGLVVVPARPGPVVPVPSAERRRDGVDEVLDDLFGTPDDRGAGPVDAALVIGGVGVAVVAAVAGWPGIVIAVGVVAALLGAVLPMRSLVRRLGAARRRAAVSARIGDGLVLQTAPPALAALLAAHERLSVATRSLDEATRAEAGAVAHAALREVASLLEGRAPEGPAEGEYVAARVRALDDLAAAVAAAVAAGTTEERRARLAARAEVEAVAGSASVEDAAALAARLQVDDGR